MEGWEKRILGFRIYSFTELLHHGSDLPWNLHVVYFQLGFQIYRYRFYRTYRKICQVKYIQLCRMEGSANEQCNWHGIISCYKQL